MVISLLKAGVLVLGRRLQQRHEELQGFFLGDGSRSEVNLTFISH